jgi:hypothetical protein
MNELTDLEICQRIAEIEGVELFNSYSIIFDKKLLINMYMDKGTKWHHAAENEECFFTKVYTNPSQYHKAIYNPLTDDALCFKLMVKHSVRVEPENCSAWTDNDDGYPQYEVIHCKGTINKAICLAIIKSKE